MTRVMLIFLAQLVSLNCWGSEYEFHFWPGQNANADKRISFIADGPCGKIASARVKSIPKSSEASSLVPEQVFELDEKSNIVHSWNIPVDAVPTGIQGEILYFKFSTSVYTVNSNGKLERLGPRAEQKTPTLVSCKPPKILDNSGYAGCWAFSDIDSDKKRILAFEGVCT